MYWRKPGLSILRAGFLDGFKQAIDLIKKLMDRSSMDMTTAVEYASEYAGSNEMADWIKGKTEKATWAKAK